MPEPLGIALTILFSDIEGSTGLWERHPEAMRKALALQPNQPQALYQLADIAFKRNDLTAARTLLNRHMQVSTPSVDALWLGVRIEQRLGNRTALASYGAQLNNRYPGAQQTQAYNEGRFQ